MVTINNKKLCEHCFAEINTEPCPKCGYDRASYRNDPITLMLGSVLNGRYMIGRVIGKGGFGITYLAYDLKLDARIAVKEYYPMGLALRTPGNTRVSVSNQESEETFQNGAEKFYNEAKMVAKFNGNPNIVSVHDFFYENDTVYFTMGYLEGETLKSYIKRNPVTEGQAVKIMQDISNALMAAHSMKILHRDVSPDNIMLCDDGTIRLLDFGAARQVMAEQSQSLSVILKQGFAPLEQYQKRGKQGPWTDIYALGATVYNALTGDILDDPMSRLDDDSDFQGNKYGISDELWNIIRKSTMLKPEDRYRDVFELKKDLNELTLVPEAIVEVNPEMDFQAKHETAKAFESMPNEPVRSDPDATMSLAEAVRTERTGGETVYTGEKEKTSSEEIQPKNDPSENKRGHKHVLLIAAAAMVLIIAGVAIGLFVANLSNNKSDTIEAAEEITEEASEDVSEEPSEEVSEDTEDASEENKNASTEEQDNNKDTDKKVTYVEKPAEEADLGEEDSSLEEMEEDFEEDHPDGEGPASGNGHMVNIAYVEATSELKASSVDHATYYASNVSDGDYATAWVDGVEGSAVGQSLTIHLREPQDISRIKIYNGYLKTRYRYSINGQVTLMGVDYGDGRMREHEINVMYPGMEDVPFNYDELNPTLIINDSPVYTDTIRLTILADIPGTKYYDTCISEVEIYGR